MSTAIKLAGWEDLSSEVQSTFGEIGDALAEKPFAIRPVAQRILKWDGRKLPTTRGASWSGSRRRRAR